MGFARGGNEKPQLPQELAQAVQFPYATEALRRLEGKSKPKEMSGASQKIADAKQKERTRAAHEFLGAFSQAHPENAETVRDAEFVTFKESNKEKVREQSSGERAQKRLEATKTAEEFLKQEEKKRTTSGDRFVFHSDRIRILEDRRTMLQDLIKEKASAWTRFFPSNRKEREVLEREVGEIETLLRVENMRRQEAGEDIRSERGQKTKKETTAKKMLQPFFEEIHSAFTKDEQEKEGIFRKQIRALTKEKIELQASLQGWRSWFSPIKNYKTLERIEELDRRIQTKQDAIRRTVPKKLAA